MIDDQEPYLWILLELIIYNYDIFEIIISIKQSISNDIHKMIVF